MHAASERLKQAAAGRPGLIAQQELDDAEAKDLSSEAQVGRSQIGNGGGAGTHRRGPSLTSNAWRRCTTTPMSLRLWMALLSGDTRTLVL